MLPDDVPPTADAKHVQTVLDRLQFVEGMHNDLLQSVGKAGEELHQSECELLP